MYRRFSRGHAGVPQRSGASLRCDAEEKREGHDFRLNEAQRAAVPVVADNDFAVVRGGAGVGETTVLKRVYDVLKYQDSEIIQLALAGKAARRMTNATDRPAMTIIASSC